MSQAEAAGEAGIDAMNRRLPPAVQTLGGRIATFDPASRAVTMTFRAIPEFCHSKIIVQGGFITGMIDSAMAQAVLAECGTGTRVPTLEIKVSFISPGHPGELVATGRIVHLGRSTAFLSGELHQEGRLVATATATARVYLAEG